MTQITNADINAYFDSLVTEKQQKFNAKLIPTITNVLGIRIPDLRTLAKKIAQTDWRTWLLQAEQTYMEHIMLQGLVMNYAKMEINERLQWFTWFIPKIDNWAVCDSVTMTYKVPAKHKALLWEFIQPYLVSNKEFEVRFGLICMLSSFVEEQYLPHIFTHSNSINHSGYYVRMAVAWLLSVCCVKFPEQTTAYFKANTLPNWTHNKAIQKSCESFRISNELKAELKTLKRKTK